MKGEIVVGLDIGSTNTTVAIAEFNDANKIEIIGSARAPTKGMSHGVVNNIDALLQTITQTIDQAEQVAGQEVDSVFVSIGGKNIDGLNSHGIIEVGGKEKNGKSEIDHDDIDRAIQSASNIYISSDTEILDVFPQKYIVDNTEDIRNPIGMLGKRLEADVHIVTCSINTSQNIIKAVNRAGFRVRKLFMNSYAAATTALTKDEKEIGVLLIDFGGNTTNYILIKNDAPILTQSFLLGGSDVTTDLSYMLKIPMDAAERLKCEAGVCIDYLVRNSEPVSVSGIGGRQPMMITTNELVKIINPRIAEIFSIIKNDIDRHKMLQQINGIILVGGTALMPGITKLCQDIFNVVVRIGQPSHIYGTTDKYRVADFSTVAGIVELAHHELKRDLNHVHTFRNSSPHKFTSRIKNILRNFFE